MAKIKPCGEGRIATKFGWVHAVTRQVVYPPLLPPRHYEEFAKRALNIDELDNDWDLCYRDDEETDSGELYSRF